MRKKPNTIDLELLFHRTMVLRAYHALLSYGGEKGDHHPECMLDKQAARHEAPGYALRHWEELQ